MRNGQNKNRMRNNNSNNNNRNSNNNNNNNHRRNQNPMTRVFDSNGPDIKIRGTASHVAEKYVQLARDARSSGDPVAAENYYQHAEHYFRLIAAAQEQFRQNQQPRLDGAADVNDAGDEGESDGYSNFGAEPGFAPQPPQPPQAFQPPAQPRDNAFQQQPRDRDNFNRDRNERIMPQNQPQPMAQPAEGGGGDVDRLPSFITGGVQANGGNGNGAEGGNFPPAGDRPERNDRFPRRRRRPGPRPEGGPVAAAGGGDDFNRE